MAKKKKKRTRAQNLIRTVEIRSFQTYLGVHVEQERSAELKGRVPA